jgi:hypothetical protein
MGNHAASPSVLTRRWTILWVAASLSTIGCGRSVKAGAGGAEAARVLETECNTICEVTSKQPCGGDGSMVAYDVCVQDCIESCNNLPNPSCQSPCFGLIDCLAAHASATVECNNPLCAPESKAAQQCGG